MQHPILKQHPEQAGKAVLAEHEVVFLRDGAIPANLRSFNSRAGFFEGGVSVLPCVRAASGETYALVPLDHALKDLRGNLPESGTLTLVEGELAPACGTAGEPLLATVTRALLLVRGEAVSGRASTCWT